MSYEEAVVKAKRRAVETGKQYAVVTLDDGEDRRITVASMDYVESVEFEAFDGRVLHVVE